MVCIMSIATQISILDVYGGPGYASTSNSLHSIIELQENRFKKLIYFFSCKNSL